MSVSSGTSQVFSWFQSITSSNLLVNWSVFALDHIALHRALKAQGYSRENLPYKIPGGQYAGPISLFFHYYFYLQVDLLYLLKVNGNLPISFSSYFVIPLFFGLYIFSKLFQDQIC